MSVCNFSDFYDIVHCRFFQIVDQLCFKWFVLHRGNKKISIVPDCCIFFIFIIIIIDKLILSARPISKSMEEPQSSKRMRVTKSPKTWQKARHLHPHQRFRMYNPLHMDFYQKPTFAKTSGFSFENTSVADQHKLLRMEVKKIAHDKRALRTMIEETTSTQVGGIVPTGSEKTFELSQSDIKSHVNLNTAKKHFDLKLEGHAPYRLSYTRNGSYLCLGGSKGHLAILRWKDFRLISEEYFGSIDNTTFKTGDYIFDVQFCMNESMLACAQREAVYIYNAKCVETHVLRRSMSFPLKLQFLPYHFLLTSIVTQSTILFFFFFPDDCKEAPELEFFFYMKKKKGLHGRLVYLDISTGRVASTRNTNLGECDMMCANQSNAVIHLGHNNGIVTLWTPTNEKPVVSMLCHKSRIRGLAVDYKGNTMATSDSVGNLKVWDLRTYRELISYKSGGMVTSCTFSQKGLLAFSTGRRALIWNLNNGYLPCDEAGRSELNWKQQRMYLQHTLPRQLIYDLKFCPYEDILGIGHTGGFTSIIVPGSGEPNFDIFEADPFETRKQSKDRIVYQLLDKLSPDMIQLDKHFVGSLPNKNTHIQWSDRKPADEDDKKFARKNITKSVKKGYKGVIKRRYHKFQHMKDLQHRQDKLKMTIKNSTKLLLKREYRLPKDTQKNPIRFESVFTEKDTKHFKRTEKIQICHQTEGVLLRRGFFCYYIFLLVPLQYHSFYAHCNELFLIIIIDFIEGKK
ncbi:U3 snoRNP-associated protein Utp7 [Reticulomyxa filosa]|uniref:U3 snoRNP-associated protein Utp7 n=1 Tax=Reticulomyxa filosa TaxID=46433 RepID=X6NKW1_RETFI|nr:U3 snoRNP-associated protein Utp7 [Reticulomyxa filosa]|eukprot:ETO26012.1 U3 snoRNP-associated protein Utp7 [Reticulomyxa filosa]